MRTRARGYTVTQQSLALGLSESTIHRMISKLKIKYDAVQLDELKSCYIPPVKLEEIWSKKQIKFIEDTAWIKQMLSM